MPLDAIVAVRLRPEGHLVGALVAVSVLLALAGCTPSAPTPAQPKPAATRAATASPAAGAPKAAASPSVSAQASPSPRVGARVRIGDASLSDSTPWLSLQNTGDEAVSLAAWRVEVGDQAATVPEDTMLPAGEALTLHAREGISTETEVFLGVDGTALARAALPGIRVRLVDTTGRVVAETTVPRI